MPQEKTLYDTVAYPGGANPKTHPDNMAVMGTLYGLKPAPIATCRVLEIGCSEGHNIVPMAYAIPGSHFVGVDLAAEPIAAGQRRIQRLGLTNVRLIQADLMDLDARLGTFDYIIVHGIYSWVPDSVREGLMAVIKKLLAPQGIAFVSYNTYPGGFVRRMLSDMMKHYNAGTGDPAQDVSESLTYLQFIFESMPETEQVRPAFERELKQMQRKGPYVTFHDELAEAYEPVYYYTFAHHAARHGLEPLCDAEFPLAVDPFFNPEITAIVNGLSAAPIQREQTLDFIRMRRYRESLLCHAGSEPGQGRSIDLTAIDRLLLASKVVPDTAASPENGADPAARFYRTQDGIQFEVRSPAIIFVLDRLIAVWPGAIPMTGIRTMMEEEAFACDANVVASLFRLILNRAIELHAWPRPVAAGMPARPRVSAYCRDAAVQGTRAISLLHLPVDLADPILRTFVTMLDGTRAPATLISALHDARPDVPEQKLIEAMQPALNFLYRMGLFLADEFDRPS